MKTEEKPNAPDPQSPCLPGPKPPLSTERDLDYRDLSRRARYRGLGVDLLFVDSTVLEDYAEIDSALGENFAGAILNALRGPGLEGQRLRLGAFRRQDGRIVELDLGILRFRLRGQSCAVLERAGEHSI